MASTVLNNKGCAAVGDRVIRGGDKEFPLDKLDAVILQVSDLSIAPDPVRLMLVFGNDTLIVPSGNENYDRFFAELDKRVGLNHDAFLRAMDCATGCDFTLYTKSENSF